MTDRDRARLDGVHIALVRVITDVFSEMDRLGAPMFVIEGVRTRARQAALYAQGRTLPGSIVTYKDGVIHQSNHQVHRDGVGYAVDAAFVGPEPFAKSHLWEAYGQSLERHGVKWGGRWSFGDLPHAELAKEIPTALNA